MNPLAQFEASARKVWRAEMNPSEKGERLRRIRRAIAHYLERLEVKRVTVDGDPWTDQSFDRVRRYLTGLAADVEELSLRCERQLLAEQRRDRHAPRAV